MVQQNINGLKRIRFDALILLKWMRDDVPLVLKTGGDFIFLIEIQVWLIQSFHGFDSEKSRFWASQFTDLGDRKISNFNH